MLNLLRATTSALALAFLHTSASQAAQELIVKTDQTQLISISGTPGAVVIGNPSIADATVHGNKIFVHGRAFGSTNLIILDESGNQLTALDITVQMGGQNNLAVYKAGARYSYVCAPSCEAPCKQVTCPTGLPTSERWTARNRGQLRAKRVLTRKRRPPPNRVNFPGDDIEPCKSGALLFRPIRPALTA